MLCKNTVICCCEFLGLTDHQTFSIFEFWKTLCQFSGSNRQFLRTKRKVVGHCGCLYNVDISVVSNFVSLQFTTCCHLPDGWNSTQWNTTSPGFLFCVNANSKEDNRCLLPPSLRCCAWGDRCWHREDLLSIWLCFVP